MIKGLMNDGMSEFEAYSKILNKIWELSSFPKQLEHRIHAFWLEKNTEKVDYLTPNGEGIAKVRRVWQWPVNKMLKLPQEIDPNNRFFSIDFRHKDVSDLDFSNYDEELFKQSNFDTDTIWPKKLPKWLNPEKIMEDGKNPGLGIRNLHKQGIDGKGVKVCIIDQTLLLSHQEYKDNLKLYEEIGLHEFKSGNEQKTSMHGSAVSSILVGKNCGVAPKSDLYYVGSDWWIRKDNCESMVKSIERILEINKNLPLNEKIRVISISGNFVDDKNYNLFKEKVAEAAKQGVFVITVNFTEEHNSPFNIGAPNISGDPDDPQSYSTSSWIFGNSKEKLKKPTIYFPQHNRTVAGFTSDSVYTHNFIGGASWQIPWIAGCYALCCQVKPDITPEMFMNLAFETGDILNESPECTRPDKENARIVNPQRLIEKLKTL